MSGVEEAADAILALPALTPSAEGEVERLRRERDEWRSLNEHTHQESLRAVRKHAEAEARAEAAEAERDTLRGELEILDAALDLPRGLNAEGRLARILAKIESAHEDACQATGLLEDAQAERDRLRERNAELEGQIAVLRDGPPASDLKEVAGREMSLFASVGEGKREFRDPDAQGGPDAS